MKINIDKVTKVILIEGSIQVSDLKAMMTALGIFDWEEYHIESKATISWFPVYLDQARPIMNPNDIRIIWKCYDTSDSANVNLIVTDEYETF